MTDQGNGILGLRMFRTPANEENMLADSGRGVLLMKAFMDEFNVLVARRRGAEIVMAKLRRREGHRKLILESLCATSAHS